MYLLVYLLLYDFFLVYYKLWFRLEDLEEDGVKGEGSESYEVVVDI